MDQLRSLVETWGSACADFSALAHRFDAEQWRLPTDCPGWSVGDIVAHCAALESELAGDEPIRVTIDKQAPHINGPAGVYTERGVVARRVNHRSEVVREFDEAVRRRSVLLEQEKLNDPAGAPPITPGGISWNWVALLRSRPLDVWVHEQDIRRAIGLWGGLNTPGARHAQGMFGDALPDVVTKSAAPAGSTVVLFITGPLTARYGVEVDRAGRAVSLFAEPPDPTVRATLDTETFTILGAGRRDPATVSVDVKGDLALAKRIFAGLTITL